MEPQNRISVPHEQSEYTRQIDALQRQLEAAEHLIHRKNCDLAHVVSVKGDAWGAVGYIGPNISHHMAGAAMYVLRSSADINQYFQVRDE